MDKVLIDVFPGSPAEHGFPSDAPDAQAVVHMTFDAGHLLTLMGDVRDDEAFLLFRAAPEQRHKMGPPSQLWKVPAGELAHTGDTPALIALAATPGVWLVLRQVIKGMSERNKDKTFTVVLGDGTEMSADGHSAKDVERLLTAAQTLSHGAAAPAVVEGSDLGFAPPE
ncbi:hypothetical protein PV318_00170 [Streptomyces sp. ME02-6991-2B]|nr:hypothetical protein [Streptomyces sp. ME02-6991-2B]